MLLKQPGHSAKRTEILKLRRRKKDDLSEMPGFLSGRLTVLVCGQASMLSDSIRKMFLLCLFADFFL